MNEKQLGIEGLADDTNVVLSPEKAKSVGCQRSTSVGEIRKMLATKKQKQTKPTEK